MAYDENLAERIRRALERRADIAEKKMFGGLAFLSGGKMFCGIVKDELMVRVGPERYDEALRRPYARPMDFTGRPMQGYVFVIPAGCGTVEAVAPWVAWGADFVAGMGERARPRTRRRRPPRRQGTK